MQNKKDILVAFFAGAFLVSLAFAAPRLGPDVTKTSRNEGNTRVPLYISVSSTSWSTILSASGRRRDAVLYSLTTASYMVCLSTTNNSDSTCSATLPGLRLEAGASYTDYSEAILYGRVQDAGTATVIYGEEHYDSADASGG